MSNHTLFCYLGETIIGGNALKHLNVARISRAELATRMQRFTEIWETLIYNTPECPMWYFEFPMPLADKDSAGDLDVIYTCAPADKLTVLNFISDAFNTRGSKRNGDCTSIEWENLQVDMIYTPDRETLEWAANWYSHGDFMALTGRVFRYYHFILKNNGLYFSIKRDHMKEEIFVTRNWPEALNLLAFPHLSKTHMVKETDIQEFIFSSKYAFPGIYNIVKPERPLKRPMQLRFYQWLEDKGNAERYPRSHGWKILYTFYPKLWCKARLLQLKLYLKELAMPPKRLYKKMWNKTLKPKVYAMLGKELNRSKRNARN